MIVLARTLVRIVSFLLLVILALGGLALAVFSIDTGTTGPSLGRLASLLHLASVRDTIGGWFGQIEAGGPVAVLAGVCGLAAILTGLVLLVGLFVPRAERLITMSDDGAGNLGAQRRPFAQVAAALAEQAEGVTGVRAKARPRRRSGGKLQVRVGRTRPADPRQVRGEIAERVGELTGPFKLKTRIEVTRRAERVQ